MKNQINYIESDDLIYYYYLGFTFWGNFAHKKLITFNLLNKILYKGSVWGGRGLLGAKATRTMWRGQIWATKKATADKLGGRATHDGQK